MLRAVTASLFSYCPRAQQLTRTCASSGQPENRHTVDALRDLSVDVSKIRKLKGWVLYRSPAYVSEVVTLLRGLGADGSVIARVLQLHPEAVLCEPEVLEVQRELWMSVCSSPRDLVAIIEKFPSSFFTFSSRLEHQKVNIAFFYSLGLNKRVIAKLMASAPQSFGGPVEHNKQVIRTLQRSYLDLGGDEVSMRAWLQKLLIQNPYMLRTPLEAMQNNLKFLQDQGFTRTEVLQLFSTLKGFVTEVQPEMMRLTWGYFQETLGCTGAGLHRIILKCPSLLSFSVSVLAERFRSLCGAGISLEQITETPAVLELTPQIVHYRIQKLTSSGYDIRTGSLEPLTGTKKDFETSCGKLHLRQERPLFNPVAPPSTHE